MVRSTSSNPVCNRDRSSCGIVIRLPDRLADLDSSIIDTFACQTAEAKYLVKPSDIKKAQDSLWKAIIEVIKTDVGFQGEPTYDAVEMAVLGLRNEKKQLYIVINDLNTLEKRQDQLLKLLDQGVGLWVVTTLGGYQQLQENRVRYAELLKRLGAPKYAPPPRDLDLGVYTELGLTNAQIKALSKWTGNHPPLLKAWCDSAKVLSEVSEIRGLPAEKREALLTQAKDKYRPLEEIWDDLSPEEREIVKRLAVNPKSQISDTDLKAVERLKKVGLLTSQNKLFAPLLGLWVFYEKTWYGKATRKFGALAEQFLGLVDATRVLFMFSLTWLLLAILAALIALWSVHIFSEWYISLILSSLVLVFLYFGQIVEERVRKSPLIGLHVDVKNYILYPLQRKIGSWLVFLLLAVIAGSWLFVNLGQQTINLFQKETKLPFFLTVTYPPWLSGDDESEIQIVFRPKTDTLSIQCKVTAISLMVTSSAPNNILSFKPPSLNEWVVTNPDTRVSIKAQTMPHPKGEDRPWKINIKLQLAIAQVEPGASKGCIDLVGVLYEDDLQTAYLSMNKVGKLPDLVMAFLGAIISGLIEWSVGPILERLRSWVKI